MLKEISEINTSFTLHEMHVACRILVHYKSFHFCFQPSYLHKMVCFLEQLKNRLLKPLCGKMLDWLNFHLEEIIGLIHALEKRYYQHKTLSRYYFGSVYVIISITVLCRFCIKGADLYTHYSWLLYAIEITTHSRFLHSYYNLHYKNHRVCISHI